ncbi:MAG TPA: maleylpyruvate isomerase family mycothiol-dependent enzyme [Actinomycetota bacterium]
MALTDIDLSAAYKETRERIVALVSAPGVDLGAPVPATPEWTIKDVVGHLAGVCADILDGNLDGVTTPPWTAVQVEKRKEASLEEVVEEWAEASAKVEPIIPAFPGRSGPQFVGDVVTHEHDLRAALGEPGARDSAAVRIGVEFMVGSWLHHGVKPTGLALLVDSGERRWGTGEEEPATSLRAEPFELLRLATGRRSVEQVRRLDWTGDPEPFLPTLTWGPFQPSATDLPE